MLRLPTKRRSFRCQLACIFSPAGAARRMREHATPAPQSRPFFLTEEEVETHGRKTWFDRLLEIDPGGVSVEIAGDYQDRPPRKIAVLPFVDEGTRQLLTQQGSHQNAQ